MVLGAIDAPQTWKLFFAQIGGAVSILLVKLVEWKSA